MRFFPAADPESRHEIVGNGRLCEPRETCSLRAKLEEQLTELAALIKDV